MKKNIMKAILIVVCIVCAFSAKLAQAAEKEQVKETPMIVKLVRATRHNNQPAIYFNDTILEQKDCEWVWAKYNISNEFAEDRFDRMMQVKFKRVFSKFKVQYN